MSEEIEAMVVPEKQIEESGINLKKYYEDVRKMYESVEAADFTDQQNKEYIGDLQENSKKNR